MPRNTYGDTVKKRVKRLLEALLDFVNYEFEGNFDIECKWEAEDSTHPKLIVKTTLVTLELLTAKDKYPDKLTKPQIREALNLLKDFLKILEDNRTKAKGFDTWHFTLTLWSKDREKNLKQFDKAWEDSRPEKSKTLVSNYQQSDELDWRDICNKVLATQPLRRPVTTQQYELNIYVPLGLMERPKTPNPRPNLTGEDSRSQQEPEPQIVQTYKDNAFFQKVIAENHTENCKHIAIIGEPGAGKTTLLGRLAERLPKNYPDVPICIRLADLRDSTIADYLLNNWLTKALQFIDRDAENVTPEIRKEFKQLFAKGKVWLLLDGVDEMAAESPVLALAKIREQLTDWVCKARVVLTCRLNVWDATISNTLTNFDTYKTLEFEPDDVDEFICQWFEQANQDKKRLNSGNEIFWREQAKRLQRQLKAPGKDNIRRMVCNPLRLSMLCQSWFLPEQDLPETKAALYEQFATYFFYWKQEEFQKKHQRVLKETEKKQIKQALAKLALAAMESVNRFRIEQEFAIDKMEEEWFDLADELGWLVLVDRDNRTKKPVYAFFHPTFQEYFAARAIEDWHYFLNHIPDNPKDSKASYRIFEQQWREVILLWLGRREIEGKQKQEFIDALINFEDGCGEWSDRDVRKGFYEYRAYFLAVAALAEFQDYSQIDEIIEQIVKWKFGCFDTEKQKWIKIFNVISNAAMEALAQTQRPKAIDALVERLNSRDLRDYIRGQVAESLGKIGQGNQKAIDALVQLLNSPALDWEATLSLSKIASGNQKAIADLEQLLKLNLDDSTRCLLPVALGYINPGNQKAIAALEQLLNSSILDDDSRRQVAVILKEIDPGNQKAIPALEQQLSSRELNNSTRCLVAKSLGEIDPGNQTAIDTLVQQLISSAFSSAFDEEYDSISQQVALMLKKIDPGNQKAIDALVQLLTSPDLNNYSGGDVAESLGEIAQGNQKAIAALEQQLTSPALNNDSRREVAASLGKIDPGNQNAIAVLVQLLNSTHFADTRWRVTEILGKIGVGNQIAIDALVKLLNSLHLSDFTRWLVAKSLGEIDRGNQTAIDALVQLLNSLNRNDLTFLRVTRSLGRIGQDNQTAIDALVQLLNSPHLDDQTRGQVAVSLKKMKIETDKQFAVIKALKANFSNFQQIDDSCYELIWHYAQNMPYPNFYQAWHQDTLPDSATASLNLAHLPQFLAEAINDRPDLCNKIKLICIDSDKFANPENPATKIYNEMRLQGCDKSEDGKPKTMAELQDYWDELRIESEIPLFFICYDSTALSATPTGFSEPFLKALSKFDRAICVACEPGDIPLQTFSPQQQDLVAAIVQWLEKVITEN